MKQITFKKFKDQFIVSCKQNSACEPEFKKVLLSSTWHELLLIIKTNIIWCCNNNVITLDVLALCPDRELMDFDIYLNKKDLEINTKDALLFNSAATLRDNSTATLWDNSYISIYKYGKAISINDNAICRELSTGKIYLSNSKAEIIYV